MRHFREEIDKIDKEIIELIGKRAELAGEIALAKNKENLPLYQPDREQEIYTKLEKLNPGIVDDESLKNIYREIMSATLRLEGSIKVGYFGAEGSFTHQAALRKFGRSLSLLPFRSIDEVFLSVQRREIRYGVVPIENSTEGMVNPTLDALLKFDLQIYTDIILPIQHSLLGISKSLPEIKRILTHPQAYGQCRDWISLNLPQAEWQESSSTSEAVKEVMQMNNSGVAAIASAAAGELYGLPILVKDIADYKRNFTRFIVVGHDEAKPGFKNRTMISFGLPDKSGALYTVLEPFVKSRINMTGIESRPDRNQTWAYIFFVDLEGHIQDEKVIKALDEVKKLTSTFRCLGSYPTDASGMP